MSEVIGENEAKALYEELYKQLPRKKNLSMLEMCIRDRHKIKAPFYDGNSKIHLSNILSITQEIKVL